ncbi:MAG: ATP-binding protein [Thiohalocapsa sp.]
MSMPSSHARSNAYRDGDPFPRRNVLTWLFLYRLLLAALLAIVFSYPTETPWLETSGDPATARLVLAAQAALILLSGLLIPLRWPTREQQIMLAVIPDIITYTLLMHISGGVGTGLGLLPAIAVIAGAILMEGRLSLLFASLATLAVIAQQVYAEFNIGAPTGTYTEAGLLGLTYFAVALLVHVFTSRLRETERLAARRKLNIADLSKINEYVIQSMSTGVVVVDGDRNLLLMNNAARHLLGTLNAHGGEPFFRLVPRLRDWFVRELRGEHHEGGLIRIGDEEVRPTLHLLGEDRASGALIYLRDHRDLLRQAQEIKLASLGRLTASIAHNIRNPLSSVTHAAQLLAESDKLSDDDRHLLGILQRNALRIDETVTSVLELSRRGNADRQTLDLGPWLTTFCEEHRDTHAHPQDRLLLEIGDGPLMVHVDPRHLAQILRNLCDNAAKHGVRDGESPTVTLRAVRETVPDAVVVTLSDTGPGIAKANIADIFEPFFTTSNSGSGLGLYAARELAEANAIRLEYIGSETTGACFRLTFGR